jgi:pimeloyl-ACP methyl ester carboxylesterase
MPAPAQNHLILYPGNYAANKPSPLVVYIGGMTDTCTSPRTEDIAAKQALFTALLGAGYIIAASNAHGANWGNNTAIADYAELIRYVRRTASTSRLILLSQSMGGVAGLLMAMQDEFRIQGWAGIYPVCDLAEAYAQAWASASIETAYGISGDYAAKTAGHDPVLLPAGRWTGMRMRFYASDDDTSVPKADHSDVMAGLVAPTAAECVVYEATGNHGDASHFQSADLIDFFSRCI